MIISSSEIPDILFQPKDTRFLPFIHARTRREFSFSLSSEVYLVAQGSKSKDLCRVLRIFFRDIYLFVRFSDLEIVAINECGSISRCDQSKLYNASSVLRA